MARQFLDSNILVYAFSEDARTSVAEALLESEPTISVQNLNEFVNVTRRKLAFSWTEVREALDQIRLLCPRILTIGMDTHLNAVRLAERYDFATFDALIVASALEAECDVLWSEDMQHGMVVDGRLRIANPFRTGA
jgi:predicted nucleic acid-binding protein